MDGCDKKTILLVEDDAIIALSEKKALERYGYRIRVANSGEDAVSLFAEEPGIDLVLMDIDLGRGMDGTEAAEDILGKRDIPIVFLSSHTESAVVDKTEKITSYGYVVKNSSVTVLDASIKMAFKLFEANQRTQRAMNKLQATFEALPDLLFEIGLDGRYYDVQAPREDLLYKAAEQMVGKNIHDILPARTAAVVMAAVEEAHEKGVSFGHQYDLKVPAGRRWFEISVSRIKSSPEEPHFIFLARDITERKKTEEVLRENEFRLDRAEKVAKVGNWKLPLDTRKISGSPGACLIYGLEQNSLQFETIHEMALPEYREQADLALINLLKDGTPYDLFSKIRRASDGKTIDIHSIADYDRKTNTIYGVIEDVTERKQLEESLLVSNEMFRNVLDSIPQFIAWKDRSSAFLGCNRNFAAIAGLPDTRSIVGKTDRDLPWKSEETDSFLLDDEEVMESDTPKIHILEAAHDAEGRELWLDTNKVPLHDAGGRVKGLMVAFSDITAQRRYERDLVENEEMYRSLVSASPDGIAVTGLGGSILMVSARVLEMFGYEEGELLGHPILEFITAEDRQRATSNLGYMVSGVKRGADEYGGVRRDGSVFAIEVNAALVKDAEGRGSRIVFIIRNISERNNARLQLAKEQTLFRALLDSSPDHIYFKDLESRFIRANKAISTWFGVADPSDLVGKTDLDFFSKEHAEQALNDERAILATGRPVDKEERETWEDHPDTWVFSQKRPLYDNEGRIIGTLGISKDITARKNADDLIQRLLDEKELILQEVHHRMKNNMNTILSLLTLQAETVKDASAVKALEDAGSRVRSMMLLYDKLYQSTNFASASMKEYLPALVGEIVGNFANKDRVAVELDVEDFELGAKLLQPFGIIVNELVTNIMKYAFKGREGGKIGVSASLSGEKVRLEIRDDGVGLPEGFDPRRSTGFGLMLIDMLTRQLNGELRFVGGKGTSIVLEFGK
jgi:PAS domain S-box-containing protein